MVAVVVAAAGDGGQYNTSVQPTQASDGCQVGPGDFIHIPILCPSNGGPSIGDLIDEVTKHAGDISAGFATAGVACMFIPGCQVAAPVLFGISSVFSAIEVKQQWDEHHYFATSVDTLDAALGGFVYAGGTATELGLGRKTVLALQPEFARVFISAADDVTAPPSTSKQTSATGSPSGRSTRSKRCSRGSITRVGH